MAVVIESLVKSMEPLNTIKKWVLQYQYHGEGGLIKKYTNEAIPV